MSSGTLLAKRQRLSETKRNSLALVKPVLEVLMIPKNRITVLSIDPSSRASFIMKGTSHMKLKGSTETKEATFSPSNASMIKIRE